LIEKPLATPSSFLDFKAKKDGTADPSSFKMMMKKGEKKGTGSGSSKATPTCSLNKGTTASTTTGSHSPSFFPKKLYEMLQDAEVLGFDHIISWLPCGTGLKVHSQKDFENSGIVSRYFKQTRYKSFQKQLNLYRFRRTPDGPKKGSYSHHLFRRDRLDLCRMIGRPGLKNDDDQQHNHDLSFLPPPHCVVRLELPKVKSQQPDHSMGKDHLLEELLEGECSGSSNKNSCNNNSRAALMISRTSEDIVDEIIFTFGATT
jgi:hypothetical protein